MVVPVENSVKPRSLRWVRAWTGTIVVSLFVHAPTDAQVTSDNTLGSVVNSSANVHTITGGTQQGKNLFHSFREFSLIPTATNPAAAIFNHDLGIETIITRVTGGSISNINGLIQTQGNANLFLLNPNGIIFGEQAALNIGGSFVASTANSLKFSDGKEFNTTASSPLLSISVPIGLQYGTAPGKIQVQGPGNYIYANFGPFEIVRSLRPTGLAVAPGKTLALIGGAVELQGGNLTAEQGHIEIGAVANSTVTLTPTTSGWNFTYPSDATFQPVTFTQAASADASGNSGGKVRVQGSQIKVLEGSSLLSLTVGSGTGGEVTLNAPESVTVQGESNIGGYPYFPSSLLAEVNLGAAGKGGNITVNTGRFLAADGAKISTSTSGDGDIGQLTIKATEIELQGASPNFGGTTIAADVVGGTGNGGEILLIADRIRLTDGGGITATTVTSGTGSSVQLQAKSIEFLGGSPLVGSSGLFVVASSTGATGDVSIRADQFRIAEGAELAFDTAGAGNTGTLDIVANSLEVTGTSPNGERSTISMQVRAGATGKVGRSRIEASRTAIAQGGVILAGTAGDGDSGFLSVIAQDITLTGLGSGIFAQVYPNSTGNAGILEIATNRLFLSKGAQIATSTSGTGNAGALTIKAQDIELQGMDQGATGIFAAVYSGGTGQGAELVIEAQRLRVLGGAQIAADTLASGNAGALTVRAKEVELAGSTSQGSSGLFAGAIAGTGAGGDVDLMSDRLIIRDGATISTSNFPTRDLTIPPGQGGAGDMRIQAKTISLHNGSITASTATGGRGNINLRSQTLTLNTNSLIKANSQGTEPGGNIQINTNALVGYRNSDITANAVNARGGQVSVTADGIFGLAVRDRLTSANDITATSELGIEFNGDVQINTTPDPTRGLTQLPEVVESDRQIVASCEPVKGSELVITGRGGLPENASQPLRGGTVWEDLRSPSLETPTIQTYKPASAIVEAQGWIISPNGKVELVATLPQSTVNATRYTCNR